ncbi:MAG: type II secretion system protein GspD [Gemmatimonadaceae bacterium]
MTTHPGDSVIVRLMDVDVRAAVQALTPFLNRPVVIGNLPQVRVSVETPGPIPRAEVQRLLRELLEGHGLELSTDSAGSLYRVRAREPVRPAVLPVTPSPTPPQAQAPELFAIRLRHAKASEVAATVNALYGRASALGEHGERPMTLARAMNQPPAQPAALAQAGAPTDARGATLAGETTIVPDPRANTLLIRATRSDYDLIQAAVDKLDVRPLQVLIEVLIAEVRRDRAIDLGVGTNVPKTTIAKTENTTIEGRIESAAGLGDFAIRLMGISGIDVDATIRAAESRGDARIINRPILLAANNERAEINVGSQRPFVQVARALPTDAPIRDQIVQYKEVGTKLTVRPTISADGFVQLEVLQEVSSATGETQFDAPVISQRSVQTQLLVKDSQTVVLGGLSDRQKDVTSSGIPILSSIPIIGGLFGSHNRRTTETELFVFLTPRVIRNEQDAQRYSKPMRDRAEQVNP